MLKDAYGRTIDYLRISVTDRCNFRCTYCMPEGGVNLKKHAEMLSYERMAAIAREAAALGICKVRITGGEPLVRKNLERLVSLLAAIPGITERALTTNGVLLTGDTAGKLKTAGLDRITISLDTLHPDVFKALTRGGDVSDVLRGIDAARSAGFENTKINMVVFADTGEAEIETMREFCAKRNLILQTIMQFSLYERKAAQPVPADRPPRCADCNRLRLTADGYLLPCLFSDKEIKVDLNDIPASITAAVGMKPENGDSCRTRHMPQIGG